MPLVMKRLPLGSLSLLFLFNAAIYVFLQPGYLIPDGVGYLAYLPVIFARHTLSFFSFFSAIPMGLPLARTSTGWVANLWPFGLSFLSLPFYEAARFSGATHGQAWGPLFLGNLNLAGILFGGAAALLLYDALPAHERASERKLLVFLCFLGTPLFFYTFCIDAVAHAASAFTSGLFLWFWLKTRGQGEHPRERWFTLGLLGGIATMVRTQEIFILAAPLWEWIHAGRADNGRAKTGGLALLGLGFCAGFLPQALIWKALYGHFFYSPQIFNFSFENFALGKSLFSSYHGLFVWTPLYLAAILGLIRAGSQGNWEAWPLLAILILQILANSFYTAWWDMLSFSLRLLTGTFVIAGLGVSALVDASDQRGTARASLWAVLIGCSAWSLLLALHSYAGSLDLRVFYPWRALLTHVLDLHALAEGWRHALWQYGKMPPVVIPFWLGFELAVLGWLWGLKRQAAIGPQALARFLCWTFGPWILYAGLGILRAECAPKPRLPERMTLNAEDLGHIFMADSFNGKALYWLDRRRPDLSLQAIEEAERILPRSPSTQNFRDEFDKLRKRILDRHPTES